MAQLNNPMEILKLLDKSNCRKCNEATCLAFAAAVARGQRAFNECPCVEEDVVKQFGGEHRNRKTPDSDVEEVLNQLKGRLRTINLAAAAKRLNTPFKDGILTIKVCGKDFSVDSKGNFSRRSIYIRGLLYPYSII